VEATEQQLQAPVERDRVIAGIAALLLLIGMPVGWLGGNTSTGDVVGCVVATVISLALLAGIFLWLLPRERAAGRAARTSLILAIVALVLIVVFWTGFCFGFAAGAVALGLSARAEAPQAGGQGKATAAIVLGALVMLVAFVGLLIG
jgi:CBS domain containing-hemolysin-like protein